MVRLRPPSVPVGARWTLTHQNVILIWLLIFALACLNDHLVASSNQMRSRNFSSRQTFLNMSQLSRNIFIRPGSDVTVRALEIASDGDSGIPSRVDRREDSSVEFHKLNRLRKDSSKENERWNSENPNSPSVNVNRGRPVVTGNVEREHEYSSPQNMSKTPSRSLVSQALGSEFENVNLTVKSTFVNKQWVPRVMLDLYEAAQKQGHAKPYGADTVRSFTPLEPVSVVNQTVHVDSFVEEDNRGYEGREGVTLISSTTPETVSYSFLFQLVLHKGEHVRNLLLRLHTIVEQKRSPAGLERRLRVLVARHPTPTNTTDAHSTPVSVSAGHTSRVSSDDSKHARHPRLVEVARKDVYLYNHSWVTLNVRPLLRLLESPGHVVNVTLVLQIERAFASVGDTGELALDPASGIDFQPLLLLYTSPPNVDRKAKHQLLHFASRPRRSVHENDWDWDGGEDGEEDEPEPPGRDPGRKGRRAGRRRRAKNICKKRPLKVDFESIGWQDWVIAPLEYEAYQCSGKCFYPLASHLNPTKHAVIQTLVHSRSSERARRACCVPTLLGPISLLYLEDGVPTFKKEYGDMVALECGCR